MNIPEEFKQRMQRMLGDEYDEFLESYSRERAQGLRINTLKIDIDEFKKITPFKLENRVPWEPGGFYINEDKPGKHPYHPAGLYYLQEPSAMSVVASLGIKKGEKVLDLCAAPGGKSTQAAAYLQGEGLLVANEIEPKRARILSENIERLGIKNAVVTNNAPRDLEKYFQGYFDRIIVDAPCSGEGMFKKEEAAVEDWSPENVVGCSARQKDILESAARMLKPEGYLVYSTCTFSIEENEMVIDVFLKKHSEFTILNIEKKYGFSEGLGDWINNTELNKAARLFPHRLRGEGHFLCLLYRSNGEESDVKILKSTTKKEDLKEYFNFARENLVSFPNENLYILGENLYSLPSGLPEVKGLRIIRPGLHIGEFKKNRFEPNHALALALKLEDAANHVNLQSDSSSVLSYLKGDTLNAGGMEGWCIVGVDGYPLGWGKVSNGILKNHYPKGLRW